MFNDYVYNALGFTCAGDNARDYPISRTYHFASTPDDPNIDYFQFIYNDIGLDKDGFDCYGRTPEGYDRNGRLDSEFDEDGFDKDGFDRDGYGKDGFDRDGRDRDGFDRNGFDRDGFGNYGRDKFNRNGRDRDGFDRDGFDRDGFDRDGFDFYGYNRRLRDRNGKLIEFPKNELHYYKTLIPTGIAKYPYTTRTRPSYLDNALYVERQKRILESMPYWMKH